MSTTYALCVPTTEEYDLKLNRIPVASLANFALTDFSENNGARTATYTYSAGAAASRVTLTASRRYDVKRNMTFNSIRLNALVSKTVSETGEVSYEPIDAVIAWNVSGMHAEAGSHPVNMVSILMSIFAQELTGANGTPTSKVADAFDHDVLVSLV